MNNFFMAVFQATLWVVIIFGIGFLSFLLGAHMASLGYSLLTIISPHLIVIFIGIVYHFYQQQK